MSTTPTYTDDSLQQTIVGAAHIVSGQLSFNNVYSADLINTDIKPDPTAAGTRDDNFLNLVCMKAAALTERGAVRLQSGIVIRDNGSMVDLRASLDAAIKLMNKGWAAEYEEQKWLYQSELLEGQAAGAAVIGAFRGIASAYYGEETDANFLPRAGDVFNDIM